MCSQSYCSENVSTMVNPQNSKTVFDTITTIVTALNFSYLIGVHADVQTWLTEPLRLASN